MSDFYCMLETLHSVRLYTVRSHDGQLLGPRRGDYARHPIDLIVAAIDVIGRVRAHALCVLSLSRP